MRKLLGAFACLSFCLTLGVATTGCTKKEATKDRKVETKSTVDESGKKVETKTTTTEDTSGKKKVVETETKTTEKPAPQPAEPKKNVEPIKTEPKKATDEKKVDGPKLDLPKDDAKKSSRVAPERRSVEEFVTLDARTIVRLPLSE